MQRESAVADSGLEEPAGQRAHRKDWTDHVPVWDEGEFTMLTRNSLLNLYVMS